MSFLKNNRWHILAVLVVLAVTGVVEHSMGRLTWGPDGRFGLFSSDVWSSEQSQRVMDPYSPSHFIHGILFYGPFDGQGCRQARTIPVCPVFVQRLAASIEVNFGTFDGLEAHLGIQ